MRLFEYGVTRDSTVGEEVMVPGVMSNRMIPAGEKKPSKAAESRSQAKLAKDLRTLELFIRTYCRHRHGNIERTVPRLKGFDFEALGLRLTPLCEDCLKLLCHAFVKRAHCPLTGRPSCKRCATHCFAPAYRERIREVMRYSGRRLVLSGRLDMLFKLWF